MDVESVSVRVAIESSLAVESVASVVGAFLVSMLVSTDFVIISSISELLTFVCVLLCSVCVLVSSVLMLVSSLLVLLTFVCVLLSSGFVLVSSVCVFLSSFCMLLPVVASDVVTGGLAEPTELSELMACAVDDSSRAVVSSVLVLITSIFELLAIVCVLLSSVCMLVSSVFMLVSSILVLLPVAASDVVTGGLAEPSDRAVVYIVVAMVTSVVVNPMTVDDRSSASQREYLA